LLLVGERLIGLALVTLNNSFSDVHHGILDETVLFLDLVSNAVKYGMSPTLGIGILRNGIGIHTLLVLLPPIKY
jgi:hypothetical protein